MQRGGETAEDKRTLIILKTTMKRTINISLFREKEKKKHTNNNKMKKKQQHATPRNIRKKKQILPK